MSTTNILDSIAVARRTEECPTIFGAYSETKGLQLAQSHTAAPTAAPSVPATAPQLGGGSRSAAVPPPTPRPLNPQSVVGEHEVFKNDANALALFFYRHPGLDGAPEEGPFWFSFKDGSLVAGTGDSYAVFPGIDQKIIDVATKRGVIMLVEFENQQPYRCTPCYLSRSI